MGVVSPHRNGKSNQTHVKRFLRRTPWLHVPMRGGAGSPTIAHGRIICVNVRSCTMEEAARHMTVPVADLSLQAATQNDAVT